MKIQSTAKPADVPEETKEAGPEKVDAPAETTKPDPPVKEPKRRRKGDNQQVRRKLFPDEEGKDDKENATGKDKEKNKEKDQEKDQKEDTENGKEKDKEKQKQEQLVTGSIWGMSTYTTNFEK